MLDAMSRPRPAVSTFRASWAHLTVPERMVIVMRHQAMLGLPTTEDDFREAAETCDLSLPALKAGLGAAKQLYAERYERAAGHRPLWETDPAWRDRRVAAGALLVTGALGEDDVLRELRLAGWSHPEIAALWDEVMEAAARLLEQRATADAKRLRAMKFPGVAIEDVPELRDTF